MDITFEIILLIVASILLICVLLSKISDRLGVPILLLFIGIGMLAGSEGIGGIYFDDPHITQYIGIISLSFILFSSGLDTKWTSVSNVAREGISLATIGVIFTAIIFGVFTFLILKLSLLESFLIGAIISSTDAAAVFSILHSAGINLKPKIASLLELESGSNDPIAVLLTITLISFITYKNFSIIEAIGLLILQIIVGVVIGWLMSRITVFLINKVKLGYEGLYNIMLITIFIFTFSATTLLKGSGFLAVYLLGLLLGKVDFLHKRSTIRFFDSMAWFSQIILFLTLGLLVFPSKLIPVMLPALLLALLLVFIARPIAVFVALIPFKFSVNEKIMISWVGLRGAVPIVLATYPLVAEVDHAELIFNIIFFVVLVSVLLQGTLLPQAARILKVKCDYDPSPKYPIEITSGHLIPSDLKEIKIPANSNSIGKAIFELGLPPGYLIVLISSRGAFIQPNGATIIEDGDALLALTEKDAYQDAKEILTNKKN